MHLVAIVRVDVIKEIRAVQARRTDPVHFTTDVVLPQGALAIKDVVGEGVPPSMNASSSSSDSNHALS